MASSTATTVKSAMRTLDVIEYVVTRPDGVVAQDIAGALGIPVSSLSYLLATLVEREYLHREGRRYSAGPGLDRLRRPDIELSLSDRARPLVRSLRVQLNETSTFFLRTGWEMEAAVNETSEHTLRYSIGLGSRVPLHCVAAGKAMLAALDEATFDRYISTIELRAFTPNTITDRKLLATEIDHIRKTGVGLTRDEFTLGICGLGTAVTIDGEVVGGFGVAMPTPRFAPEVEERARALLIQAAATLVR
jgi:IclR family transcriptional regulator, acetate operon repressor